MAVNVDSVEKKALGWIKRNSVDGKGIIVTSRVRDIYPEVTGYYIPTLLNCGEQELAMGYAKFLCCVQKQDGAWYDSSDRDPYIFDSAQILKGLIAIREILPEVDGHIIAGCDWLISRMDKTTGRLVTPSKDAWTDDDSFCSELIHTYCLTPLVDAANIYNRSDYYDAAMKIKNYYIDNYRDKILNFSLLSHFYAYVMEGLLDLGEEELIRSAMKKIETYQNAQGGIPGLCDVEWECSTGMFQLALVWFKLGEIEKGNKIFEHACALQNKSGGWYGSYPISKIKNFVTRGRKKAYYFPKAEISWANKYFFDALFFKRQLESGEGKGK